MKLDKLFKFRKKTDDAEEAVSMKEATEPNPPSGVRAFLEKFKGIKLPKPVRPRDSLRLRISIAVALVILAIAIITNAIILFMVGAHPGGHKIANALLIILAFCIIGGVLTFIFTESIVAPMEEFKSAAKRISGGDFKVRLDVKGNDEVAQLSEAFNYMCAELEHLDEKRRVFVSDASHELKTPMATIKLISDTLVGTTDPDTEMLKDFLNDLSEEIDRLTRIVERLLKLTELESKVTTLKSELVDYALLVNKIVAKLEPIALGKTVTLSFVNQNEDMQPVAMDVDKIWEAVYNIVDNAIKYTKIGSTVTVEISVEDGRLVTRVFDEGPGIPDKFKEKIFERFYRIDDSRARNTGGTGLGLAIAKEIMVAHQGEISVLDGENGGSVFVISLPYNTMTPTLNATMNRENITPSLGVDEIEVKTEPDAQEVTVLEETIKEQDAAYEEELSVEI